MAALAQVSWSGKIADRAVVFLRLDPATYLARKIWAVVEKFFSWIGWLFGIESVDEPVVRRSMLGRGRSLRFEQPVLYNDLKRMLQKPADVILKEWEHLQKISPPFVLQQTDRNNLEKNRVCLDLFGLDISQVFQLHENGVNRFLNILPTLATRVAPGVNANWVLNRKYIIAQTPTAKSLEDFNRMLSDPDLAHARLVVFERPDAILRSDRSYFYDASVTPVDPLGLAQFVQSVYNQKKEDELLVVCCESGIGASGLFIAVYELYQKISCGQLLKRDLDRSIFCVVEALRRDRYGMIQTRGQYELIYKTLNILVDWP